MPNTRKGKSTASASSKKTSARKAEKEKIQAKEKEKQEVLQRKKRMHDEIWAIVLIAIGTFFAISLQTEATGEIGHFVQVLLFGCFGRIAYGLPYYLILYGILVFSRKASYMTFRSILCLILLFLFASVINASFYPQANDTMSIAALRQIFAAGAENGGVLGILPASLLVKSVGKAGLYIVSVVGIMITLLFIIDTPLATFFDSWKIKRMASRQTKEEQLAINRSIIEKSAQGTGRQRMEEELERARKVKEASERAKEERAPEREETRGAPDIHISGEEFKAMPEEESLPRFTPETIGLNPAKEPQELTDRHKKIIEYVTDETLFGDGKKKTSEGFGLEGSPVAPDRKAKSPFEEKEESKTPAEKVYRFPPVDLLKKPEMIRGTFEKSTLQNKAKLLEETLSSFGVSASVLNVVKGPTVTRYEIQPSAGVKVASIVRLADDIALNLKAKSIRIEAPIPGKAAIGIEVENESINKVVLRELIESKEFRQHKSKIAVAVGKGISGDCIVTDLKDMPHLLIAGATGSGKSVYINTLIISILYRAKPEEVKLLLIDPKVVELGNYNGIPHLLIPVVTEPQKAAAALSWAVSEMTDRYKKFAEEGVRDLDSYNESVRAKGEDALVLPQIVMIIDELADLMMIAPSQVEESICRLAQMARAAGMHLIVATQRPSVDVITGVIKANIPSRIAFAVSSQFDSRTILDMGGAEKLVGKGDMLFSPQGLGKPLRVQGCFISDAEVHSIISYMEKHMPEPEYAGDVIAAIDRVGSGGGRHEEEADELLTDAIETVVRAEQASVSMLQRRFRIGYNRAARLVDMMEERGIIGPSDGSRPRKVLMSLDQFLLLEEQAKDQ
ncbi:MAG: DNA translocase FtsK [Bacillota bacterium]|nr:DNA translocase FtsK [Eubacteriales bacterium]MDD3536757.1 DNA translocase FtsK [Eubacteriales bacterium]MDD4285657.1 DNA translocase FtsK [Eubacteriales bacterium]MDI9492597.1 DNA translocase FtsK [Bacillota bacterium]HRV32825.1 DNA translocase FtsK [Anaerovoracaceae bacterium]